MSPAGATTNTRNYTLKYLDTKIKQIKHMNNKVIDMMLIKEFFVIDCGGVRMAHKG